MPIWAWPATRRNPYGRFPGPSASVARIRRAVLLPHGMRATRDEPRPGRASRTRAAGNPIDHIHTGADNEPWSCRRHHRKPRRRGHSPYRATSRRRTPRTAFDPAACTPGRQAAADMPTSTCFGPDYSYPSPVTPLAQVFAGRKDDVDEPRRRVTGAITEAPSKRNNPKTPSWPKRNNPGPQQVKYSTYRPAIDSQSPRTYVSASAVGSPSFSARRGQTVRPCRHHHMPATIGAGGR